MGDRKKVFMSNTNSIIYEQQQSLAVRLNFTLHGIEFTGVHCSVQLIISGAAQVRKLIHILGVLKYNLSWHGPLCLPMP